MQFEFDSNKSQLNEVKHGINLECAKDLWLDPHLIMGPGMSASEERWIAVGLIDNKHWCACFTYRQDKIRIIECRGA